MFLVFPIAIYDRTMREEMGEHCALQSFEGKNNLFDGTGVTVINVVRIGNGPLLGFRNPKFNSVQSIVQNGKSNEGGNKGYLF